MTDYYAVLGVTRSASINDIRRAYRERMRSVHPDSQRVSSAAGGVEVTRIAEAWSVLSSPQKRAAYDLQLATGSAAQTSPNGAGVHAADGGVGSSFDRVYPPARFPWRFVLVIIGIGTAIVLILHIMGDPMPERGIDGLINAGACVNFDELGAAYEVPCDGPHQAVVRELVPFDSACDSDTTRARDRQGMGTVCIEP